MSRKSSRLCRILFTALLAALILVVVPYAKVKADDEDNRPIDFEVSFDGAQSWDEYEVYYAFNPAGVTPGAITYTKVEGDFTGDDFTEGKADGYFVDRGDGWALYGARFSFEDITTMRATEEGDEIYIRIVTKKVGSKPAKTIMYGNARYWVDAPYWYFEEKSIIGDDADDNYSIELVEMSQDSCTYEITANLGDFMCYSALNFGLAYPRQGDIRAEEYIEGDIFAYGDLDGSGSVDVTDIKRGIAVDLCRKYFWEEGGILSEYYEIRDPYDILNSKKLYSEEVDRLTVTSDGTVQPLNKTGEVVSIQKYTYNLELGYDCDGKLITVTGDAYGLTSTEQVLVQADGKLFIRDVVRNDGDSTNSDEVAFGNYDETPAGCVTAEDFSSIKFGGNGAATNYDRTYNPDGSTVLCIFMMNDDFAEKYNKTFNVENHEYLKWNNSSYLRIIGKNNRYAIVEPCEGYKRAEGLQKDPVCMTGGDAYVETFAGYKELKITSLSSQLGCTASQQIKDIKLVDRSMSKGVRINPINEEDSSQGFKVTFKSNFYDEVPLEITYEDGVTCVLTIKRIALVVRYVYLADPTVPGNENADFCYDFGNPNSKVDYNYGNGEQIIIYAQYYHTENDNSDLTLFLNKGGNAGVEIINKNIGDRRTNHVYRKDATDECVAETFFLLGFARAHDEENHSIDKQNVGAWDAMVLNAGYDGSSSFGGAQFGSGAGFHWDGWISWQY